MTLTRVSEFQRIIGSLKEEASLVSSLHLRLQECRIAVNSNSPELIAKLREYYRKFVEDSSEIGNSVVAIERESVNLGLDFIAKQPDPGKKRIKEEYVDFPDGRIVRKRLTGMLFAFGGETNIAAGNCLANFSQIVNFVNNRYIEWMLHRGGLLAHAAGIELKGSGIAIAGISGAGKSTLSLQLMDFPDCGYVSNDRLVLRQENDGLKMLGIPKHPRVNPGTILNNRELSRIIPPEDLESIERLDEDELWNLEQKYDVIIGDVYGDSRFVLGARTIGLILLSWHRTDLPLRITEIDLATRPDLLATLMKETGLFYSAGNSASEIQPSPENYIGAAKCCRVFEFSGGVDFPQAAQFCHEFLLSKSGG